MTYRRDALLPPPSSSISLPPHLPGIQAMPAKEEKINLIRQASDGSSVDHRLRSKRYVCRRVDDAVLDAEGQLPKVPETLSGRSLPRAGARVVAVEGGRQKSERVNGD